LKSRALFSICISLLLTGLISAVALGADPMDAISKVKLTQEKAPPSIRIEKETIASKGQLIRVRPKMGFPLTALLNQVIIYESDQAQVNYMSFASARWADFGYSRLIASEGRKSLVFEKEGVLIQMVATTKELEDWLTLLLRIDRIQTLRIKFHRLPEDWSLMGERFLTDEELRQMEQKAGARIARGIEQDVMIRRNKVKVRYYECITEQSAEKVGDKLAERKRSIGKRLVRGSGSVVVAADSPTQELNEYVMGFVNW